MDPVGQVVFVIIALLFLAALILPRLEERSNKGE